MALLEINWRPSVREVRQLALIGLPLAGLIVAALLWSQAGLPAVAVACGAVICLVSGLAIAWQGFGRVVYVGWMLAAYPLGWLISHMLLGAVYFGCLTPLRLLMSLLRRDPLQRDFQPQRSSYWQRRKRQGDGRSYLRQY